MITKNLIRVNMGNLYVIDMETFATQFSIEYKDTDNFNLKIINTCYILYDVSWLEFVEAMKRKGIYISGGPSIKAHILSPVNVRLYDFITEYESIESLRNYYDNHTIIERKKEIKELDLIKEDAEFFRNVLKDNDQNIISKDIKSYLNKGITYPLLSYENVEESLYVRYSMRIQNVQYDKIIIQIKLAILPEMGYVNGNSIYLDGHELKVFLLTLSKNRYEIFNYKQINYCNREYYNSADKNMENIKRGVTPG